MHVMPSNYRHPVIRVYPLRYLYALNILQHIFPSSIYLVLPSLIRLKIPENICRENWPSPFVGMANDFRVDQLDLERSPEGSQFVATVYRSLASIQ